MLLALLLLLPTGINGEEEDPLPKCNTPQWFWFNVKSVFVQPFVDATTLVMDVESAAAATEKCTHDDGGGETCEALGIGNGLDVIAVYLHVVTGWRFPFVSHDYCPLRACPRITSVRYRHASTPAAVCRLATATLRCALEHWHWAIPWLLLIALLTVGFILALILHICVACSGPDNM